MTHKHNLPHVCRYMFSAIGQQLFGGKLSKDPSLPGAEALFESVYRKSGYWPLNFNDMFSGFTTMFTLLYINNMQIVTAGCSAVTSNWAELFFGIFYVIGVLYCRNIFTSFLWSRIGKILDPDENPIKEEEFEELLLDDNGNPINNAMLEDNNITASVDSECGTLETIDENQKDYANFPSTPVAFRPSESSGTRACSSEFCRRVVYPNQWCIISQ